MNWNVSLLLLAGVLAGSMVGCGGKEEQPAGGSPSATGSAAAPGKAGSTAAPGKAADASPKASSLPINDFLSKVTPAACGWIDQCKNEKVKALTAATGMMIAGFGALDKPELSKQMKTVETLMNGDKRSLPNKQECETIGGVVLQVIGMTPESLQAKIGKTVQYDGEKAAACLATFASPFEPCNTEVKLTGEPKMSDISGFEKELEGPLDAYMKACEGMLTGMVEVGQACEADFECKGEHSKCKTDPKNPKAKACAAGDAKR